jgi:nucleoid-associated protein EbfC
MERNLLSVDIVSPRLCVLPLSKTYAMFGDMFGDMDAMQRRMQEKLAEIEVESVSGDGAIKITANGNRELVNISIDPAFLAQAEPEELEDLLLVAVNRAISEAAEQGAAEAEKMMQDLLPPGMSDLFS